MFTIIGSTGFVGQHLIEYLKKKKVDYFAPTRDDPALFSKPLGHIIYCAGLTADFRTQLLQTVEAHVCLLKRIIQLSDFQSLLYLSSTRVYQRGSSGEEETLISATRHDPSDIYNLSKLLGESLCLSAAPHKKMRVVRLSNVYGPRMGRDNFLASIIEEALKGKIILKSSLESTKDYVYIHDIVPILVAIAERGENRLYNLASGYNVTNEKIVSQLASFTRCKIIADLNSKPGLFPEINIEKIRNEFGFSPSKLEENLPSLVTSIRQKI